MDALKQAALAAVVILALDVPWIAWVMGPRYDAMVKHIQSGRPMVPRLGYAIPAYLAMVVAVPLFVLPRVRPEWWWQDALLWGGLFGLVLYAVYDFTAAAVLVDWDLPLALLDVGWGAALFAVATLAVAAVWR